MEKIPGCWEHMSIVWNELKSSKSQKGSLAAIWLDIANAYGSVPHQLIFFALRRYGVPEHWVKLIMNYYKGLWSISQSSSAPSSWHHHLRGIFIGCTASIIIFLSAINVVIIYIERLRTQDLWTNELRDHYHEDGNLVPSTRPFFYFEAALRL